MTAKRFLPFFGLAAFAAAAYLVYRAVRRYDPAEIVASILAVSIPQLLLGLLFVAGSYFSLTLFDTLAVRYVGAKIPYRRIALASFTALSIGHTVGFAAASSATIRYRFYSGWNIPAGEIAKIIVFCAMTVALGLNTLAGIALLLRPEMAAALIGFSETVALTLGGACLGMTAAYLCLSILLRGTLTIWQWELSMPAPKLAFAQTCVGTINFCFVAAALHQVLLANIEVTYIAVATIYVLGNFASLLSHVPGGLGVLEAVVIYLLPQAAVVGALLAFRGLYFFLPFVIGVTVFAIYELRQRRRPELKGQAASMVQER
jgi:glycosyltransferase 2 family protein